MLVNHRTWIKGKFKIYSYIVLLLFQHPNPKYVKIMSSINIINKYA